MTFQHETTGIVVDPQTASKRCEFQSAFEQLARAAAYAMDTGRSLWDFAVEIESLARAGLTTSDLRWLVTKGYLEHARETTGDNDTQRRFQPSPHLAFFKRTCFVLTELGERLTPPVEVHGAQSCPDRSAATIQMSPILVENAACLPSWDKQRRILHVDGQVVKQFRVPSFCQEAILAAFEEEGWPPAIDDPLPPHAEQDPKRRLRNTVQSLNTNQKNSILRFHGDGSGLRVLWELREPTEELSAISVRLASRAA